MKKTFTVKFTSYSSPIASYPSKTTFEAENDSNDCELMKAAIKAIKKAGWKNQQFAIKDIKLSK